jgi:hypothetical protein
VLVGDAARKFTPSTGEGCNHGILDVLALANELYDAFRELRDKAGDESTFPDGEGILKAFEECQTQRWETVKEGMDGASRATGGGEVGGFDAWVYGSPCAFETGAGQVLCG